jgi:protein MAK16
MNVTGLCKMAHCPLANSQYATVVEKDGKIYLCIKTPERAHLPRKMWEKILLPYNLEAAFAQIDKSLRFWDARKIRRCKLRYHRLFLVLRRMRKLKQRVTAKIVPVKKKVERRLKSREAKAEKIAMLEHKIEAELLERLRKGVYPKELYQTEEDKEKEKMTNKEEEEDNVSIEDMIFEEDNDTEDELHMDTDDLIEFDFSDAEEDIEDIYNELEEEFESGTLEDTNKRSRPNNLSENGEKTKRKRVRKHLEIEYETDRNLHTT